MSGIITYKQLDVGDEVVPYSLDSTLGMISFLDIIEGKWCILVTCAAAFDPVTTTDIGILVTIIAHRHSAL
jgi:alkyl hydroperoxide reductase subunit AhpC